MDTFLRNVAYAIGDVVGDAFVERCRFQNDTKYKVLIIDHIGIRALNPDETSRVNYLAKGFSVDLVVKLTDAKEEKINFPSSKFENRTQKMSMIFAHTIKAYELSLVR